MKRRWPEEELIERWTLAPDELPLLSNKTGTTRLGFPVLLRFFAGEGRFPKSKGEVSGQVVSYLAKQVGMQAEEYQRALPDARLVYLRGSAGHNAYQDEPRRYTANVRAFVLDRPLPETPHHNSRPPGDYEGTPWTRLFERYRGEEAGADSRMYVRICPACVFCLGRVLTQCH